MLTLPVFSMTKVISRIRVARTLFLLICLFVELGRLLLCFTWAVLHLSAPQFPEEKSNFSRTK